MWSRTGVAILVFLLAGEGCAGPPRPPATAPTITDTPVSAAAPRDRAPHLFRNLETLTAQTGRPQVKYNVDGQPTEMVLTGDAATAENVRQLDQFPTLTRVTIFCAGSPIPAEAVRHLGNLPALEELRVSSLHPHFSKETATEVARIRTLRVLFIRYARVDEEALQILARLPALRTLAVCWQPSFGDADAAALARFASVEELDLSGTSITDGCLVHIAAMPRLKKLNVSHTRVSSAGLAESGLSPRVEIKGP